LKCQFLTKSEGILLAIAQEEGEYERECRRGQKANKLDDSNPEWGRHGIQSQTLRAEQRESSSGL